MPPSLRRIPGRLATCQEIGQQANTHIRAIIVELARKKETNLAVIYAQLHLIVAETEISDKAWGDLEFGTREDIKNGSPVGGEPTRDGDSRRDAEYTRKDER